MDGEGILNTALEGYGPTVAESAGEGHVSSCLSEGGVYTAGLGIGFPSKPVMGVRVLTTIMYNDLRAARVPLV